MTSEVPMPVQVSLIDRGLRFIEASFLKTAPRFLPWAPRHHTFKSELASGEWGSDRGGRGEMVPAVSGCAVQRWELGVSRRATAVRLFGAPSPTAASGLRLWSCAKLDVVHIRRDHPDTGEQLRSLVREEGHAGVPPSGPSSGHASVTPSGHDRST